MAISVKPSTGKYHQLEEYILNQQFIANPVATIEEAVFEYSIGSNTIFSLDDEKFKSIVNDLDELTTDYVVRYSWSGIPVSLIYETGNLEKILLLDSEELPLTEESETLFIPCVDDWMYNDIVTVYGTLSIKKGVNKTILELLATEEYSDMEFIVSKIEFNDLTTKECFEAMEEENNGFQIPKFFLLEDVLDFKKNAKDFLETILDSISYVEEDTNCSVNGLELVNTENNDIVSIKVGNQSYPRKEGVVIGLNWKPFGKKLLPIAEVDLNGDSIQVPLYAPKNLILLNFEIGMKFLFSTGELLGNVPLMKDGYPAISVLDLL